MFSVRQGGLAQELGGQARFVETDVTSEASAQAAIAVAVNELGGLHGLVNCAGIATAEKVLGKEGAIHSLANFQRVISINLVGSFNMIRLAADAMNKGEPNAAGSAALLSVPLQWQRSMGSLDKRPMPHQRAASLQ